MCRSTWVGREGWVEWACVIAFQGSLADSTSPRSTSRAGLEKLPACNRYSMRMERFMDVKRTCWGCCKHGNKAGQKQMQTKTLSCHNATHLQCRRLQNVPYNTSNAAPPQLPHTHTHAHVSGRCPQYIHGGSRLHPAHQHHWLLGCMARTCDTPVTCT